MKQFSSLKYSIQLYIASKILKQTKESLIINGFSITDEMENIAAIHITEHKPLSKIFQTKSFWKDDFLTNEHTLDPRPETENLIELFNSHNHQNVSVVEFGIGTGAILLSIMKDNPNITGIGIDISLNALQVCEQNAKKLNLKPRLIHMDLNDFNETADILISNPPYLTQEEIDENPVLRYDPHIALYGGHDGLKYYNDILEVCKRCKFKHIYLEVPPLRMNKVKKMFSDYNVFFI